jgi:hypothetical protein
MPAIPPYIINVNSTTGLRMADVGLKGDEYFMLVESVSDSAEFQEEIVLRNTAGKRIYHALIDPVLTYAFSTKVLAFNGIANAAPGTSVKATTGAITPALLNNVLANTFQFAGGSFTLRRPRRTRRAGDLADFSFDIEVTDAAVDYGIGRSQHTPAAVSATLTYPASELPRYDVITGLSLISLRTIDVTGPISGYAHLTDFQYWQTWPAGNPAPSNYTAYKATYDTPANTTGKEIREIHALDVPGGRAITVPVTGSGTLISTALAAGTPVATAFPVPDWSHIIECVTPGGGGPGVGGIFAQVNASGITTAAGIVAGGYVPSGYVLQSVFQLSTLTWLTVP